MAVSSAATSEVFRLYAETPVRPLGVSRFRKDILRTGRWVVGGREWNVTPDTLHRLKANYDAAHDRGIKIPVVWDHSQSARDRVGHVVELVEDGATLQAVCEISDVDAERKLLANLSEVSVEVHNGWTDGEGNDYDVMLTHLGLVNLPVVPDQGPFLRLSLEGSKMAKDKQPLRLQTDGEGGDGVDGDTMISVADAKALIEEVTGQTLPEEVDTAKELRIAVKALFGKAEASEPAADSPPDVGAEALLPAEATQMSLHDARSAYARERQRSTELSKRLSLLETQQRSERKAAFTVRLNGLLDDGRVPAKRRDELVKAGEECGWQLSLLSPYEDRDVPENGRIRRLGLTNPPRVSDLGGDNRPSAEACKARADRMLGRRS